MSAARSVAFAVSACDFERTSRRLHTMRNSSEAQNTISSPVPRRTLKISWCINRLEDSLPRSRSGRLSGRIRWSILFCGTAKGPRASVRTFGGRLFPNKPDDSTLRFSRWIEASILCKDGHLQGSWEMSRSRLAAKVVPSRSCGRGCTIQRFHLRIPLRVPRPSRRPVEQGFPRRSCHQIHDELSV